MADKLSPLFMINGMFPAYSTFQPNFELATIQDKYAYILDAEGWKLYQRNNIITSILGVKAIDGGVKLEENIKLFSTKIPYELIKKVTAFFVAVYKRDKSEAVGYLYYNPADGKWDFIPPMQTASAAAAHYDQAPKKDGWLVVGTIHSHGSMSAFHSHTDEADEKHFDGVHITIGKVNDIPEYCASIVSMGEREKIDDLSDLVEGTETPVPPQWMNAVRLSEPSSVKDSKVGKQIKKIYDLYFEGKIIEKDYLKRLEKLEEKMDRRVDNSSGSGMPESVMDFFRNRDHREHEEDKGHFNTRISRAGIRHW